MLGRSTSRLTQFRTGTNSSPRGRWLRPGFSSALPKTPNFYGTAYRNAIRNSSLSYSTFSFGPERCPQARACCYGSRTLKGKNSESLTRTSGGSLKTTRSLDNISLHHPLRGRLTNPNRCGLPAYNRAYPPHIPTKLTGRSFALRCHIRDRFVGTGAIRLAQRDITELVLFVQKSRCPP